MEGLLYRRCNRPPNEEPQTENLEGRIDIQSETLTRQEFPALADNDFVYLNSGGSGPPSQATIQAMRSADDLFCGPIYSKGIDLFIRQAETNTRARTAAARLVGAAPNDVALAQNTTHGMNLGVGSIDWKPGDRVVSTTTEHPGCLVPLHNLISRFGVEVTLVEPPITPEKIQSVLTPDTRLIALSHVDWTTGEVLPLQEICTLARGQDVLTLVDGAQSVGNIAVNLPAIGVDMYAFTGHKWVLGPEGIGTFYVRPGLEVYSPNVGYAAVSEGAPFDKDGNYELRPNARRFEASTINPALAAGFAAAAEAVQGRGEEGFETIRHRAELLMSLLSELPKVAIRSPRPAQSGLVAFEIEDVVSKDAVKRLLEKHFVVRFIPDPNPYIRASTHLFNTEEELEALANAVADLG